MMYGISLNKDGTTKVVCQRLEHQTALEEDARLEGEREGADRESVAVVQTSADEDPITIEVPQAEPVR
jgi:hypothetical protein